MIPDKNSEAPHLVYIMGSTLSGTTAMAMSLSGHSQVMYVGEPKFIMRRTHGVWMHHRFCTVCGDADGESCPVWSREVIDAVRKSPTDVYQLVLGRTGPGKTVVVDTSKSLDWLEMHRLESRGRVTIIHLSKPVESHVASVLVRAGARAPIEFTAWGWAEENRAIREYAVRCGLPYVSVRYTDFATDTERVIQRLCNFLGLIPETSMWNFWAHPHHYIKGSPGISTYWHPEKLEGEHKFNRHLYGELPKTIFLDEKWRQVLSAQQVHRLYGQPEAREESRILGHVHPLRFDAPLQYRAYGRLMAPGIRLVRKLQGWAPMDSYQVTGEG